MHPGTIHKLDYRYFIEKVVHAMVAISMCYVCMDVYICVFLCFLPIHSGHQVRWTYQPVSHRQEEGHTGFLIHLPSAVHSFIFLARRN